MFCLRQGELLHDQLAEHKVNRALCILVIWFFDFQFLKTFHEVTISELALQVFLRQFYG